MRWIGLMTVVLVGCLGVCGSELVPFVIPPVIDPQSPLLRVGHPLTERDRLTAREHFYTRDGRRVRLWGVNLSFGANLPTHEDAVRVASRMAAFGVNSVRFHHLDTQSWPSGIWSRDGSLHPEALDRLDYFIDQLAKRGIYTNLNLHVGRVHSLGLGLPQADESYDKMVSIFMPALISAQKDYARSLLTRTNAYRGMTYAEDYAVAITEITNENSLFMWSADRVLPTLPEVYADELRRQYTVWLKMRYGTTSALSEAWTAGSEPKGDELLKNPAFAAGNAMPANWRLEQHSGCRAQLTREDFKGRTGLVVTPQQTSETDWHLQINQAGLAVQAGQVYTLRLEAAAARNCRVGVSVGQGHEPWSNLGLWRSLELTPEWQVVTLTFRATETDDNARVSLSFGGCEAPFSMSSISFRTGVQYALEGGESLEDGTIRLFAGVESDARKIDRMIFLAETEKAYFDAMHRYIKDDLGYQGMVTGTIVFGPLGLYGQSDMDFVDSHAYWQHPRFPRRQWDAGDWVIEQKAMSNHPEQGTLFQMAAERLAGKPFTVTEYNHPAPLDSQAECVPMIASFAAAQDWDGVWLYTYSHSSNAWDRAHLNSYFDIDTNPAKWGFMPAGANLFRDGLLGPLGLLTSGISCESVERLAALHLRAGRNMLAAVETSFRQQTARFSEPVSDDAGMRWDVIDGKGLYAVQNDRCRVLTGSTERFGELTRDFVVQVDEPAFAAVTVTSLDGKSIGTASTRLLVTACGRSENTGMRFSDDRSTVGRNWGTRPVLIEPVTGYIQFGPSSVFNGPGVTCKVLNPDGSVGLMSPVLEGRVPLAATYKTMWYLIERESH